MYSYFENAHGRYCITGPCMAAGDLILNSETEVKAHVRFLNEAFKAGSAAALFNVRKSLGIAG